VRFPKLDTTEYLAAKRTFLLCSDSNPAILDMRPVSIYNLDYLEAIQTGGSNIITGDPWRLGISGKCRVRQGG
jgi:hypothetical protein